MTDRSMTPRPACLGASPIAPDDERHGTARGFWAGCRDECCRAGLWRYEKKRRLDRLNGGRKVPALGAQRRIQALMRLGWTCVDIANAAGWGDRNYVLRILNGQKGKPTTWVERKTDTAIREVYERLSMRLPEPSQYATRAQRMAERRGWLPPLAYDDIDDPDERPVLRFERRHHADIDPVVVERVLAGEKLPTTRAEKDEALRQWKAKGGSEASLCKRQGWKEARYARQVAS